MFVARAPRAFSGAYRRMSQNCDVVRGARSGVRFWWEMSIGVLGAEMRSC